MKYYISAFPSDSKRAIFQKIFIALNSFKAAKLAYRGYDFEAADCGDEIRVSERGFKRRYSDQIYTVEEVLIGMEEDRDE